MTSVSVAHVQISEVKTGFFKQLLMRILPKKLHKYLTAEAAVVWQISGFISFWQGFATAKWNEILVWVVPKLEALSIWWGGKLGPALQVYWKAGKSAVDQLLDLVFSSN